MFGIVLNRVRGTANSADKEQIGLVYIVSSGLSVLIFTVKMVIVIFGNWQHASASNYYYCGLYSPTSELFFSPSTVRVSSKLIWYVPAPWGECQWPLEIVIRIFPFLGSILLACISRFHPLILKRKLAKYQDEYLYCPLYMVNKYMSKRDFKFWLISQKGFASRKDCSAGVTLLSRNSIVFWQSVLVDLQLHFCIWRDLIKPRHRFALFVCSLFPEITFEIFYITSLQLLFDFVLQP